MEFFEIKFDESFLATEGKQYPAPNGAPGAYVKCTDVQVPGTTSTRIKNDNNNLSSFNVKTSKITNISTKLSGVAIRKKRKPAEEPKN